MTSHAARTPGLPTAANIAAELAAKLFAGRKGHGGAPVSFIQLRQTEVQEMVGSAIELHTLLNNYTRLAADLAAARAEIERLREFARSKLLDNDDSEDCELCDGCGEVNTSDHGPLPCPNCAARDVSQGARAALSATDGETGGGR